MRVAARLDDNQKRIVRWLVAHGCSVQSLAGVGAGCPDLLVGYRGRNVVLELKNPAVPQSKRRLTPAEVAWHRRWSGQVAVVQSAEEALEVITREAR